MGILDGDTKSNMYCLQDQQEYVQILEQEISSLRALSAQGESIVRNMRSSSRQESLARRQVCHTPAVTIAAVSEATLS